MASPDRRLDSNTPGGFYVDDSCIDCGTCRWMAPQSFDAHDGYSRVYQQPQADGQVRAALQAALACPTASIGTAVPAREAIGDFPLSVEADVYHCGFHHAESFGAASYLIRHPEGNVLVDSPRFTRPLVRRLEAWGGVRWMFLTHRDDVADHARFAAHFGCQRILHRGDVGRSTRGVERQLTGAAPVPLAEDLTILYTPGHTRGSACLLYRDRYLFTGDTLAYSPTAQRLIAFRRACWYDWGVLKQSLIALQRQRFSWVLPGHGWRVSLEPEQMQHSLAACIANM